MRKINDLPINFEPPEDSTIDLLIIAGEHSGDEHAAALVTSILQKQPNRTIYSIGGSKLREAGAHLLFDLTESSIVGFFEVLKHYPFFKKLFQLILSWIEKHKPKAICFVDYPGFNLRLAKALHKEGLSNKAGGPIQLLYYIGPQIWAWKKKRRFAMAKYLDALAVIFPFEVDCYRDVELPVHFVGHPFLTPQHKSYIHYNTEGSILLLPGSRKTPIERIFPTLLAAFQMLLEKRPGEQATVIYPNESVLGLLKSILEDNFAELSPHVVFKKNDEVVSAKALLMSSGTMSLQCALVGIPGAIVYKVHPITYVLARRIIKIPFLGIANILLNKPVYPEFIQKAATPDTLSQELISCLEALERRKASEEAAKMLTQLLSQEKEKDPADWLLAFI